MTDYGCDPLWWKKLDMLGDIAPEETIYSLAQVLIQQGKFSAKDILHVACAVHAQAKFFLTCDDALLRQTKKLALSLEVMNPVDYIQRENL